MDEPTAKTYSVLAENIVNAHSLEWSPLGDWLAFGGGLPGEGEGVWLLIPPSQRPIRVLDASADTLAWSPDGSRLAIVHSTSFRGVGKAEIMIVNVSNIVEASHP